jgi:hypothetical protein
MREMSILIYIKIEWKLHAGYADFRYGAYVPRYKVQTFLTQLGKSSLDKRHIQEAEVYFPIWVNQYPWLLNNQVLTSNHVKVTDQDVAYPSQLNKYTVSLFILLFH